MASTQYYAPGVYIHETTPNHLVTGGSTSVCGFVGIAETGQDYYNQPQLITSWSDFTEKYGGFIWGHYLAYAVHNFFSEGGRTCYVVSVEPPAGGTAATFKLDGAEFAFDITPTSFGTWANDLAIEIANSPDIPSISSSDSQTTLFTLNVVYVKPTSKSLTTAQKQIESYIKNNGGSVPTTPGDSCILESYPGLSPIPFASENTSGSQDAVPDLSAIQSRIKNVSLFIRINSLSKAPTSSSSSMRPANGIYKVKTDATKAAYTTGIFTEGLNAFDQLEDNTINFMAMPDLVSLEAADQVDTINQALAWCEKKMSVFFIADPPFGYSDQQVVEFKHGQSQSSQSPSSQSSSSQSHPKPTPGNAMNSSYGALYYPWVGMLDSNTSKTVLPPTSLVLRRRYLRQHRRGRRRLQSPCRHQRGQAQSRLDAGHAGHRQ